MSFWSKVGDVFKSVGKGIVSMIPGMGISVASNAIGGAMSAKDAKRQHQYDLEKMSKDEWLERKADVNGIPWYKTAAGKQSGARV